jgi:hypothetical protein
MNPLVRSARVAFTAAVLLAGALLPGSPAFATDPEPGTIEGIPATVTEPGAVAPAEDAQGKECTWGCLRWDNLCNVDPRGNYKCRRSCSQFGKVCE